MQTPIVIAASLYQETLHAQIPSLTGESAQSDRASGKVDACKVNLGYYKLLPSIMCDFNDFNQSRLKIT